MKMKNIYLYLLIPVALIFTSCNKWLDIQPELEMRQTAMFESEQGFKDVLTGAYIRMATPELYGLNTTMKLPEMMAQNWTIPSENSSQAEIYYISNFDFTQTLFKLNFIFPAFCHLLQFLLKKLQVLQCPESQME